MNILLESMFLVLIVPLLTALFIEKYIIKIKNKAWLQEVFLPSVMPTQLVFLCLAIAAMFSSQGRTILSNPKITLELLPPLIIFYISNLILSLKVCRRAKIDKASSTGFCFSTLARNSPIALAISVTAFPDRPLIALALVIGPLIELPTLGIISKILSYKTET